MVAATPRSTRLGKTEAARRCLHCGNEIWAAPMASEVWCPGCRQRVHITNYVFREDAELETLETAGSITVMRNAQVMGNLRASQIRIAGRVLGHLAAYECIIEATGKVAGQIICQDLRVEPGAQVDAEIEQIHG